MTRKARKRGVLRYDDEAWETILDRLEAGQSLRRAVEGEDLPSFQGVHHRVRTDPEFAARYNQVRLIGYQVMADEVVDIADDGTNDYMTDERGKEVFNREHYMRSRLRVETRKWVLAKMLPKVYGDKVALEASGPDGGPIQMAGLLGVIAQLPAARIAELNALSADDLREELALLGPGEDEG